MGAKIKIRVPVEVCPYAYYECKRKQAGGPTAVCGFSHPPGIGLKEWADKASKYAEKCELKGNKLSQTEVRRHYHLEPGQ